MGRSSNVVGITDGITRLGVESTAEAIQSSRAVHSRIDKSNGWMSSHKFVDVAGGASVYLHIKTGSTANPHGNYVVQTEAKVTVELYENPTLTNDGTGLSENCFNRQTTATADTTCFHTPTVSVDGTLLETGMTGTSGNVFDIGGSLTDRGYWVLKKSESYLIKVTNNDAAAKDVVVSYVWHEH